MSASWIVESGLSASQSLNIKICTYRRATRIPVKFLEFTKYPIMVPTPMLRSILQHTLQRQLWGDRYLQTTCQDLYRSSTPSLVTMSTTICHAYLEG